jgi:hypothetical protein
MGPWRQRQAGGRRRNREPGQQLGSAQESGAGRMRKRAARVMLGWRWEKRGRKRQSAGQTGQMPGKEEENIFFFFFQILQGISKDFEFSFEFESNHAIQKFKCSSMNAQSCF